MKFIAFCIGLTMATPVLGQSKKQLINENNRLKSEVERLKAQVEELSRPKPVSVDQPAEKVSYSIGVMIGSNIESQQFDSISADAVVAGLRAVMEKKPLAIDVDQAQAIVQETVQKSMQQKIEKAKSEGIAFLDQNKTQPGVMTTPSGLQYKVIKEGTGKQPSATSTVTVHYTGKLLNGFVFDSSVERGQPATFGLNQVIAGWTEGLQLMKEGGKAVLFIPYNLGYGERGAGSHIPPFSTLVFEVELIKVQ